VGKMNAVPLAKVFLPQLQTPAGGRSGRRHHWFFYLALLAVALLGQAPLVAQTGPLNLPVNPSFTGGGNSVLAVAAQSDGKVLVGGNFTLVNGTAQANLARLNADGSLDTTWTPVVNGAVRAIAILGEDVFIGGDFSTVSTVSRNRLAKLSLSTGAAVDGTWNPNANGGVFALAINGAHVYAGGVFTTLGGVTYNRLARCLLTGTGTPDTGWNPNANNTVFALATDGTHIYAGGVFTTLGGVTYNRLARCLLAGTGAPDSGWNPNANNTVNALAVDGTHVYAGGTFMTFTGGTRNRLARFTLSTGALDSWNPNVTGSVVSALAVDGTHVYAGGVFSTFGSGPATTRNNLARLALAGGALDAGWNPNASGGSVNALAVTGTRIFAGGGFTLMNGQPRNRFAAFPIGGNTNGNIAATLTTPPTVYVPTGTATTLSVTAVGSAPLTYQWFLGTSGITSQPVGTNSASYTTPTLAANTSYWVRVSNMVASVNSATIAIEVGTPPVIGTPPAAQTVIAGHPASLSVAASGSPTLAYQWRKDGVDISGATGSTLAFDPVLPADQATYAARVTNAYGNVTSVDAVLTVEVDPPTITAQPVSLTVSTGGAAIFSVSATGSPPLSYQWYKDNGLLAGATDSTLSIPNAQAADVGSYHVVVANPYNAVTAMSNAATLSVGNAPTITNHPNGATVFSGTSANLSVTATGTGPLSYQWYRGISGSTANPVGGNSPTFNTGPVYGTTQFWVRVTSAFGTADSFTAPVFIGTAPTITSHPISQTVNLGANVTLTGSASGAASYQWWKNGNPIAGENGTTLNLINVNAFSAGNYTLTASNIYGSTTSNAATLTVLTPPVIVTQPVSQAATIGGAASFSVAAIGSGTLNYQWTRNFLELPGQTAPTLALTNVQTSDAGDYRVVVTNNLGSVTSNLAVLTVNVPPGIATQPQGDNVATGQTRTISVTASGSAPFSYVWYRGASGDTAQPAGGTAATFTTPALTATTSYWVRVSNAYGSADSATATLTVGDPPTVATAPQPQTLLAGFTAVFSVTAGGTPPFSYQWRKNGANVDGATGANLTLNNAQQNSAGTYTVVITNAFGSVTSPGALLTVNAPPAITTHPAPLLRNVGADAVFSVVATGTAPLAYQWKKDGSDLPGQTAATLTLANVGLADVGIYNVTVTNAFGSATSNDAALEVNSPPVLVTAPASGHLASGLTTTLAASVLGSAPFTYEWFQGETGITTTPVGSGLPNFTTPPLTTSTAYWLRVSNAFGSVDTPTAFITVGLPPSMTTQPVPQAVLAGANVTFTVATDGTAPLTYQWFKGATALGNVGNISGVNTPTLNLLGVNSFSAAAYSVRVINAFGTVWSDAVNLTVNIPPAITQQPQLQVVAAGGTANFSVTATGTGSLSYQWQKDGSDLPGEINPALAVPNAQLANEGAYRVLVTNAFGTATSTAVALTVNTPPSILQQPASPTIFSGQTATLTVPATGSGPLVYEWFEGVANTTTTPVGIDSSIFVTPILASTRQYWVRVSNAFGTAQSQTVTVTVLPAIPVINSSLNVSAPVGQLFRYRITATHTPTAFTATPLPDGITLDPATGWISGLPTTAGVTSVALTAANASHTGSATLTLTITPAVPVITSAATARARAGEPFGYQITATNAPTSFAVANLPAGLVVSPTTGAISGSPQAAGTAVLQLQATNVSGTGLAPFTLTIDPGTVPPTITSAPFASGKVSVPFAFQVQATQSPTGFAAAGLPNGLNIHPATGLITGTPLEAGDFPVALTASNAGGSGPVQTWLLRINPPAGVPVITSAATAGGPRGTAFSFQITATNSPTLYTVNPALPANLTLNPATGLISGVPAAGGIFTVNLTAANILGGSAPRPLVLTIGPSVLAPVLANAASTRGYVGIAFSLDLAATPAATQFHASNLPPGLTLNTTTGRISGTPTEAGTWAATLGGENAEGPGPELVITFSIAPAPTAPVVTPGLVFQGHVGTPLSAQLLSTQLPATFVSGALPDGLSLAPESGLIAGTPLVAGEFTVTVTAENIAGRSAPTEVVFQIAPPIGSPDIVSSLTAEGALEQPFSYRFSTTPAATTFTAEPLPPGLTLTGDLLSGTPLLAGDFDVTLTASNAAGQGWPRVLKLLIRAGSAVPQITSSPAASATAGAVFTYQITAINGPITAYRAESLPTGLSLDPQTGLLTGTPSEPGIFTIPLRAANANGAGDPQDLILTVAPALQTPVVYSATAVLGFDDQELFYRIGATNLPPDRPLPSGSFFSASNLPPGLKLTDSTGEIRGTPTKAGTFSAKVWAKNATGPGAKTTVIFTINHYAAAFKVLRPGYLSGPYDQPLILNIVTSQSANSYAVTEFNSAYFHAFTAQSTSSQFSLIPKRAGRTYFRPFAYKGSSEDWIDTVVDILPSAAQPALTSPTLAYGTTGQPFTYATTATNSPTAFGVRNALPPGLALHPASGVISGTPTAPGTFTLVLVAANASGTGAPREVVVFIRPAAAAPVVTSGGAFAGGAKGSGFSASANSLAAGGQVGVPFSYMLTASGDPVRFVANGLPDGLALNEATGEIAGTPAEPGVFEIGVSAVNEAGPGATVVLTLTIAPAAGTPVITSALAASGQVGQPFSYAMTVSPAALGFTAADLPAPLTLDSVTGVISGTPTEPGTFTLPLSAANALGAGGTAKLTLTVLAAPGTPLITSGATAPGAAGASFSFQITASTSPTAFNLSDIPFGLSLDPITGAISGTPQAPGTLTVEVWAENATGEGQATLLTFDIAPAAASSALTSATLFEVAAGVPFSFQLTASNAPASFDHSLLPAGLSLHPVTGLLTGTLAAPGDYSITVSANNATGAGTAQTLTIRAFSQTAFRGWAIAQSLPVGADGPLDAPFGDGVKNLHRFAFGLPAPGAVAGLPVPTIVTEPGGARYLALVFTRARNLTGVTFQLRGSNTVGGWQDVTSTAEVLETLDANTERVRLRDSQPFNPNGSRFLQIVVGTTP
jgi:hypothetical protein